jgi:5-methylcytosine-specific restriction enzyme A
MRDQVFSSYHLAHVKVSDLPAPVVAAKADWLAGTNWLCFTPVDGSGIARDRSIF